MQTLSVLDACPPLWQQIVESTRTRTRKMFLIKTICGFLAVMSGGTMIGMFMPVFHEPVPRANFRTHLLADIRSNVSVAQQWDSNEQVQLAIHNQRLIDGEKQMQAALDERNELRRAIEQLSKSETNHYNSISDRLNVDEAKVWTAITLLGAIAALLNFIPTLITMWDWRNRNKDK